MLGKMQDLINNHSNLLLSFGFAWFILAWLFGTFFDAFRDSVVENCKFKEKINWDFFFESDYTKVKQLDEFFYAYYILAVDLVISVIMAYVSIMFIYGLSAFYSPFGSICHHWVLYIIVISFVIVLCKNAKDLRKDIVKYCNNRGNNLPHVGVYTRLKPSTIHGVGIFAIRDIPKGTSLFQGDTNKIVWIDKDKYDNLDDDELKRIYKDFCVYKRNKLKLMCPDNFDNLTPSWYINDSKDNPNVKCIENEDYNFITIRKIKKGEELLVDYDTYSDNKLLIV